MAVELASVMTLCILMGLPSLIMLRLLYPRLDMPHVTLKLAIPVHLLADVVVETVLVLVEEAHAVVVEIVAAIIVAEDTELLETDIINFQEFGKVLLCGDLNARVGNTRPDYIVFDRPVDYLDGEFYIPDNPLPRMSMDSHTNANGLRLLDLCTSTSMRIANGRLPGDQTGTFTYVNTAGSSVIDYLLLQENNFDIVNNFSIDKFTEWSDHAPISFDICCHNSITNNNSDEQPGRKRSQFTWNEQLRDDFRRKLISVLPELNNVVQNIDISQKESVNNSVNAFTGIIRNVGDPLFAKELKSNTQPRYDNSCTLSRKADWFDDECIAAKSLYTTALYQYNIRKSNQNRIAMCNKKTAYKTLIRKKKRRYEYNKLKQIEKLRHAKPRDFWKLFSKKKSKQSNIKVEQFFEYFSNLNSDLSGTTVPEAEDFCSAGECDPDDAIFEELDVVITLGEIKSVLKTLKRSKACGIDCLLNEYFIESSDIIGGHLVDLFNSVLNSGYFPDQWSEGIIVPLFKKKDVNDVNNYRGFTLVSCPAKIFTGVLNTRINSWIENNDILSDNQFGFRRNRSTVDAIFVLNAVVQRILSDKGRLYCAFIDLKKAFDSIYLNGLWFKFAKLGVTGKMLNIIRSMYHKVKSCVQGCKTYSEFFECAVGLKQAEGVERKVLLREPLWEELLLWE
ncbi:uncharacterized protein LOC128558872 [Mercenaria mercenaria]|uniref:uncharacterized protein LOC128558872 n=1 Tax=Mercenaria mercenaria TaxID=6596 RepID=UPI00234F9264|nr:uncharacterized protein LOC128558872 [Mercenaria mercenaria]